MLFFFSLEMSSRHGIQIIEFRDASGTLFHHLEYPEGKGSIVIDLKLQELKKYIPIESRAISLVAEDSLGNILKLKLNVSELSN